MKLILHSKKGFGTKDKNVTSAWFEFDYKDIDKINKLDGVFKILIGDFETNATINDGAQNPIVIETERGIHRFRQGEAQTNIEYADLCLIKLDIYINDQVCGMIRVEEINIKE